MQDRAVVAAVVAGDPDGFDGVYDQYAASLYARCRSVLPEDEAAEAVVDTFLIASARLHELRDPDRLGSWLLTVARNECRRRMDPERAAQAAGTADPGDEPPAEPPPGLRGRVMMACTDNSPAGRAYRVSVAHRAGTFGPAGFPKTIGPAGSRWWRGARRPGVAAAVAVGAALALTAGITVILTAGGPGSRPQASGPGLAAAGPGSTSSPASSPASGPASRPAPGPASSTSLGSTSPPPSPVRTALAWIQPTPQATVPVAATSPGTAGQPTVSASPSPSPSPTQPSSPSTSPAQGYLQVTPARLQLMSKSGMPVSASFTITAKGGPVAQFTVKVAAMAGKVNVAPASGSLPADRSVTVTVTVTSKVGLTTQIIVGPGDLSVTVVYKVKA